MGMSECLRRWDIWFVLECVLTLVIMMCSLKFGLLSRVTPRYLRDLFHVMETLFILIVNSVVCVLLVFILRPYVWEYSHSWVR